LGLVLFRRNLGVSATLVSYIIPFTITSGLYALMFPFYIAMANRSQPRPFSDDPATFPETLPIFYVADKLSEIIIGSMKMRSDKKAEKA
jgi:hypothetical protein